MAKILDPNINRIIFFNSTTKGARPTTVDLVRGELAFNIADRTIYTSDGSSIVDLGFGKGGAVDGEITTTGRIYAATNIQAHTRILADEDLAITSDVGDGRGVILYGNERPAGELPGYGMSFAKSSIFGGHGQVAGGDWATYFSMSGGTNRGWIFKNKMTDKTAGNVASISSGGVATFARVDAPLNGNANTSTRPEKHLRFAGSATAQWIKIAEVDIPQTGNALAINVFGGNGYNGMSTQASTSRIILKTGNGSGTLASVELENIDGTTSIDNVACLNTSGNVWEIFMFVREYFTGYMTADFPPTSSWFNFVWVNFGGDVTTVPVSGAIMGSVRRLATLNSNVASATKLQTPRKINGTNFDGTQDINIQANYSQRLNAGTDLNTILEPGNYYCDYDSDALNIANKPIEGSFALEVLRTAGFIQRFTNYNTGRTWIRKSYVGFSPWREIALLDQANIFSKEQYIDAGVSSVLNLHSSGESAIVFYKPARRVVMTLSDDNSFGFHDSATDGGWLLRSPNSNTMIFNVNTYMPNGRDLILQGSEGDNIGRVQNGNGAITVNSPEPGMASIRNALQFNWYNDAYQIGTIRSGSQASHGLGITYGNSNLVWSIDQAGLMRTTNIIARGYVDAIGNVSANEVISKTGRFSAPNSTYHYIDVGQDGRDLTTFGQYSGSFRFLNTSNNATLLSIEGNVIQPSGLINFTHSPGFANLPAMGNLTELCVNVNKTKSDSWSEGYAPAVHASMQSESGYRAHAIFGAYKRRNDFLDGGAFIAIGGESDNYASQSFYFGNGGGRDNRAGLFTHSSGYIVTQNFVVDNKLTVNSTVVLPAADLRSNSHFQFLNTTGGAQRIATGGLLVSNAYADLPNVPANGIWTRGLIDAYVGVGVSASPGGIHNGIFPGNGDAATYGTCNMDIQTWNGLGIKDNAGNRRTVFDARNGDVYTQGSFIAGRGITAPYFQGKASELSVAGNTARGTSMKATWTGAVFPNDKMADVRSVIDANTFTIAANLNMLGRYFEPGVSKIHYIWGGLQEGTITAAADGDAMITVYKPGHGLQVGSRVYLRGYTYNATGCSFKGNIDGNHDAKWTWILALDSNCNKWPSVNITTNTETLGNWAISHKGGVVAGAIPINKSTIYFAFTDNNTDNSPMASEYASIQVWDMFY